MRGLTHGILRVDSRIDPRSDQRMTLDSLRRELDRLLGDHSLDHVERFTLAAAILSEALRAAGLEATLVGGGAIEFYAPGAHTTSDIDLVVERKSSVDFGDAVESALAPLGFSRTGRHWVRNDLFVEIPSTHLADPFEVFTLGPYSLRVVRKEIVLAERIVGFKYWRYTAYGAQAIDMIATFGDDLDEVLLGGYLRREGAEDAFDLLRRLANAREPITHDTLVIELERLLKPASEGE